MRPSSSPSEGLFAGMFARGGAAAELTDRAWLQAMLDVEAALARSLAAAGLVPAAAAEAIAARCDAGLIDAAEPARSTAAAGTPVPGLVRALRSGLAADAAAHVHRGATSQDIVDTAAMLVARRGLGPLLADLGAAADACAGLAERHRDTIAIGRTLLQQASPVAFGLKASGWLVALDEVRARLDEVRSSRLAVQLGGAVGTLAALGEHGPAIAADVARRLELAEPTVPWHTLRVRPAELACALGVAAGVIGKVGRDVVLLAQTEVGEAAEGGGEGRGGSSTLPHKRNPVGAVAASACALRAPSLVATVLAAMPQEHERAAGSWQAEWEPATELLRVVGSGAAWIRDVLEHLRVDAGRMRANVELTGGLVMAESVATALTPALGRSTAHDLVERAAGASSGAGGLRAALLAMPPVVDAIGADGVDAALDPANYLGASGVLIDRALVAHRTIGDGA